MSETNKILISKKQKIVANLIAIANTGGQQFYWNYGTLLAVNIGATAIQMSFITAIQNLGNNILQGFFGKLSDKFGRKILLFLGFLISASATFTLSKLLSPTIFMIIVAIFSIGISMIIPTWNALLGDITSESNRTEFIGKISMIGTFFSSAILLILGFTVSLFDIDLLVQYRTMIFIGSFFLAIGAILILFLKETNKNVGKKSKTALSTVLKNKSFVQLILATLLWWFIMSMLWPLSPFVTDSVNPTSGQVAVMSVVFSLGIVAGQWVSSKFADIIGRKFTVFLGLFFLCFVPLILAFTKVWYLIVITNIFGGIGNGLLNVPLYSEILSLASEDLRGMYTGIYNIIIGITTFLGSFASGIIFDSFSQNFEFYYLLKNMLLVITAARFIAIIPVLWLSIQKKVKDTSRKS